MLPTLQGCRLSTAADSPWLPTVHGCRLSTLPTLQGYQFSRLPTFHGCRLSTAADSPRLPTLHGCRLSTAAGSPGCGLFTAADSPRLPNLHGSRLSTAADSSQVPNLHAPFGHNLRVLHVATTLKFTNATRQETDQTLRTSPSNHALSCQRACLVARTDCQPLFAAPFLRLLVFFSIYFSSSYFPLFFMLLSGLCLNPDYPRRDHPSQPHPHLTLRTIKPQRTETETSKFPCTLHGNDPGTGYLCRS